MQNLFKNLALLLCFIGSGVFAADPAKLRPDELLAEMRARYPDEMAVYLKYENHVNVDVVADSVVVTSKISYEMLHLNEKSRRLSNDQIFSSHFIKISDIQAKTLAPNKKKYRELAVNNFQEKSEVADGIFYDDSKSIAFTYPSVSPGAISKLNYTVNFADPRFLTSFYFGSFIPVVSSKIVIRADRRIEIGYNLYNCENTGVEFVLDEGPEYNTFTWQAANLKGFEFESNAPAVSYFSPHIIYYVKSADIENNRQTILSDVRDLYGMYSGFIADINHNIDPSIQQTVDSIISGAASEVDKVKSIFYWVQDNIKYIAFENGMRGFIPHDGALVCKKRYGDCKDMASITHYMLKAAGINSYLTWVGSRDLPYKYSELPTPQVDNHMIVTYEHNGDLYFLDATSKYTRFGLPSSMIQGKEALLAISPGEFKIVNIPAVPKEANLIVDSVEVRIHGRALSGAGKLSMTGYPKIYNTYRFMSTATSSRKDWVKTLTTKGSNKFFIQDFEVNNMDDKEKPLAVEYHYSLEDYVKEVGDEMFINLNLDKNGFNDFIDEKRKLPVEAEYKYTQSFHTAFAIPEGYQLEYMPEDADYKDELFGFTISYKVENRKLIQQKQIFFDYLLLEKKHFADWNRFIEKLNDAYREALILTKQV